MATLQPPSPPPPPDICTVLSETKRIIKAHSHHFLVLSVLFLLPQSFASVVFAALIYHIPNNSQAFVVLTDFSPEPGQAIIPSKTLLLFLAYYLFNALFTLCAIGSITYSVFQFFYGRPVKLISAVKSILASFFPLLGTLIVVQIINFAITIPFMIILFLVIRGAEFMGFETEFSSSYFLGLVLVLAIVTIAVLLYLQVIVNLAYVVVVVESKWGLQSLRRSASLMKGMKRVVFSLSLIFMIFGALFLWEALLFEVGDGWNIVLIVYNSGLLIMVQLYNLASNTVLYVYFKAIHGELSFGNAEVFGRDYVSLPFDNEKVPHLASVCILE
ncbi:hypothetical protein FNV43_RR26255 [Rhamnella rubrinervis]|uniref:Uncharacterized protein n=1 Tax=Rhamnella rubrinervis TaxID=2594499 RepID=A0A8K0DNY6_9ROSA|nr:hypothetical protein FNV43_RR26255 [Rhamnella rubrinervis]